MTWLDKFNELRKRSGLSIDELVALTGIPKGTVSKITSGITKNPSVETVRLLVHAMGYSLDDIDPIETEKAPSLSDEAVKLGKQYDALDAHGKEIVSVVADRETARMEAARKVVDLPQQKKVIPLIGNRFAAGFGDPDLGVAWEDYEVDAGSRAEFAVHISGDSLEPHLHDGDIALAVKRMPDIGEVGAYLVDGDFLVKQTIEDAFGNLYLKAVNRKRRDTDRTLLRVEEHQLICFGTLLLPRIPLPQE